MHASFIIPALNEEDIVPLCIGAVKGQNTDLDFEIIVVDNGSTDGTERVARREGARIVRCKEKGIPLARNAGAEASKGDLLIFVDADTLLPEEYLSTMWKHMQQNPRTVAAMCRITYFGKKKKMKLMSKFLESFFKFMEASDRGVVLGCNAAIMRRAFFEVGGFPNVPSEDHAISHLLRQKGNINFLEQLDVKTSARRVENDKRSTFLYYLSRDIVTLMKTTGNDHNKIFRKLMEKLEDVSAYREIR